VGITANLLDIISPTVDDDTVVIVVVAVVTTVVAATDAAVVVVVVTVAADTVTMVEGNELTLEETARAFSEAALVPGINDLLRGEVTLFDGEVPLLPDALDTLVADVGTDVVTLLGEDMDTLLTGEVCLAGDEAILLLAAVTLVGEDTLLVVTVDGLFTGLEPLLSDTEILLAGDVALLVCETILFTGGDTLQQEDTLLTDNETLGVGDMTDVESTANSADPPTLQSGTTEIFVSGITLESHETASTVPEFTLALLDIVRLLGSGVVTATPDSLLLLIVPPSAALSLFLFTDVHGLLPIMPAAAAAVSKRCRFFGVAITV
jgi:hypothetical protein